jgi:hypothetical protein
MLKQLTKSDAVKLIFERAQKPLHEEKKAWRNKINKRLTDAIKRGAIRKSETSLLNQDDVLRHAYEWYGEQHFHNYPKPHEHGQACLKLLPFAITGSGIDLPDNLQQLKILAANQHAEIIRLNKIIEQLQPDAERYRNICETNRSNGKKKPDL